MSWDDDDADVRLPTAIPAPPVSAAYDDEEDVTLKEERLRAEAEKAKATAAPEAPEKMKEKHRLKELQKEKDRKEAEAREKARKELEANKPLDDKFAEKARQERLVQEADLAAAMDSLGFGGAAAAAGGAGAGSAAAAAVPRDVKALVGAVPLTDAKSFEAFAGEVSARMTASSNGPSGTANAIAFYKALLRAVPEKLTAAAVNDLMTVLSTIQAKKRAAERPKKAGKPAPRLGRAGGIGDDDYSADFGDDYGDLNDEEAAAASASKGAGGGGGWRPDVDDFM